MFVLEIPVSGEVAMPRLSSQGILCDYITACALPAVNKIPCCHAG